MSSQDPSISWTYLWLAAGGLLLSLSVLAFVYVVAVKRLGLFRHLTRSSFSRTIDRILSERTPRLWAFVRGRFDLHVWHGLGLTVAAIISFAALVSFALITESWVEQEALYAFDQAVYERLAEASDGRIFSFMRGITYFGDGWTITLVGGALGVVLLVNRRRWEALSLTLSVGIGAAVMFGLKWIFERSRPIEQIIQEGGHSFPSGHAFLAVTLYGWLIYMTWREFRSDALRIFITIVLALLIFLVGVSRVILRVHWTSDVAGGFAVGLAWLVCSLVLARILRAYLVTRRSAAARSELDR